MKKNKIAVYTLTVVVLALLMQSCAASKDCGCGSNINKAYKTPKRYH